VVKRGWAITVACLGAVAWCAGVFLMTTEPLGSRVIGVTLIGIGTFLAMLGGRAAVRGNWSEPPLGDLTRRDEESRAPDDSSGAQI
jgi:hypothetical protein